MTPAKPRAERRSSSAVSRKVLFSLDTIERRISLGFAAIGAVLAVVFFIVFKVEHHTPTTVTKTYDAAKGCPAGFHLVKTLCTQIQAVNLDGAWEVVALVAAMSVALGFFAWRRQRVGTIFFSLFGGLLLEQVGYLFIILGIWLGWRSWRLHKYGVPSFAEVSVIMKERSLARREGRPTPPLPSVPAREDEPVPVVAQPRSPAEASKRYTPKKTTKKR